MVLVASLMASIALDCALAVLGLLLGNGEAAIALF